jgi:predicted nucleic acid-binding protein
LALTVETHALAVQIAEEAMIDIYDANIVAAAELAGCDTLYTEDLNAGQRIGGVTIRNPFA